MKCRAALQASDRLALYSLHAMRDRQRELTYRDIDHHAMAIAAQLQDLGAKGARALLVLENEPNYLLSFLACAYAGVVAVTVHVPSQRKHADRLALVARDCDARFLITTGPLAARLRKGLTADDVAGLTWVMVDEIGVEQATAWTPHFPAAGDTAYIQLTSGSTGRPRGVVIQHGHLIYQGAYLQRAVPFTPNDHSLSWLPLFHDLGLILGALQPLYSGFPLALATPASFIRTPSAGFRSLPGSASSLPVGRISPMTSR